jgi:hypothetical protein
MGDTEWLVSEGEGLKQCRHPSLGTSMAATLIPPISTSNAAWKNIKPLQAHNTEQFLRLLLDLLTCRHHHTTISYATKSTNLQRPYKIFRFSSLQILVWITSSWNKTVYKRLRIQHKHVTYHVPRTTGNCLISWYEVWILITKTQKGGVRNRDNNTVIKNVINSISITVEFHR